MATAYYNSAGKKLEGEKYKKYVAALKRAEQTGKPYTGTKYYTRAELETAYNGYDLGDIQKLGSYRSLLKEAPSKYTAKTDDELKASATATADTDYNNYKTQALNAYNSTTGTLNSQLAALDAAYTPQVNAANKATALNVDQVQGSMLSRGLGRSSYAGALQSAALQSGTDAVNTILADKTAKANAVNSQLSTLGTNYANVLERLSNARNDKITTEYDALKTTDYNKSMDISQARRNYLLDVFSQKKKVSSSYSSSNSNSSSNSTANTNNNGSGDTSSIVDDWINGMFT